MLTAVARQLQPTTELAGFGQYQYSGTASYSNDAAMQQRTIS
jgi:hypothetical protein